MKKSAMKKPPINERSAGISVFLTHVPLTKEKKSSPGLTLLSNAARSIPEADAALGVADWSLSARLHADAGGHETRAGACASEGILMLDDNCATAARLGDASQARAGALGAKRHNCSTNGE